MKFLNTDVWGFKHAIRGARNPMNSWDKSDSTVAFHALPNFYPEDPMSEKYCMWNDKYGLNIKIGPNDMNLLQRLIKGGPEHRKFMRQIMVSVDITAPMFWWSEFDTYKIGTTANSTSKMHKLASKPITIEDFEMNDFKHVEVFIDEYTSDLWDYIINVCEILRQRYVETKDKKYWKELIRILPESYLQTRTVTMNYENLYSIVRQRAGHKLVEWRQFIDWAHQLPYANELIFLDK